MRAFASVRARTTIGATVVFAMTLGGAALVLYALLSESLLGGVDSALDLRSQDIVGLIEAGTPPVDVAIEDQTDGLVQFIADGMVIASSSNITGEPPITNRVDHGIFTADMSVIEHGEDFRIVVTTAQSPDGPVTVLVGNTLEDVNQTLASTRRYLLVGAPLLTAVAAALTWIVVGGALRPVEQIRAEVAEIGATDLHRRVPLPGSDDEIGRLAVTMNEMLDRIESGNIRQARFVSDASHELRTPIAVLRHELEVGLAHPSTADWPFIATEVLDEGLRMQRLVDDLLFLARHEQAQKPARVTLVDLDEIAQEQLKRQSERTAIRVDGSHIGAGQVRGNADDLSRVVQNLLNNAVRHAKAHVAVSVRTTDRETVVLSIEDDGAGVDPEMRERIFERFSRGDEARTRDGGGAGLGLAIASEIVREHDGTLSIGDSALGGARFTLVLRDARADPVGAV